MKFLIKSFKRKNVFKSFNTIDASKNIYGKPGGQDKEGTTWAKYSIIQPKS